MTPISITAMICATTAIGLGTLSFRLAFVLLERRGWLNHERMEKLKWVPTSVLSAMIAPALVPENSPPVEVIAALAAATTTIVCVLKKRNMFVAIILGSLVYGSILAFFS